MEIEKLEERIDHLEKGMTIVAAFIDDINKEIKSLKKQIEEQT